MSPWDAMVAAASGEAVRSLREKLLTDHSGCSDESEEAFVAMTQVILDDLTMSEDVIALASEADEWGDNRFSLQAMAQDRPRRSEAFAWAIAGQVRAMPSDRAALAIRLLARYGDEAAWPAMAEAARTSPKLPSAAWKWIAEQGVRAVGDGTRSPEEVSEVLRLGSSGSSKRIVGPALERLGEPAPEAPRGKGRAKKPSLPTLEALAAALGCAAPTRIGEEVVFGRQEGLLGAERLALVSDKDGAKLLGRAALAKVPAEALSLLGGQAPEWVGRATVHRAKKRWLLVRLDRLLTPHDRAARAPGFDPELVMGALGRDLSPHEDGCLALVATEGGVAAIRWYGAGNPLGLDEPEADESTVQLLRFHW